jgi:hypothetical protein
MNKDRLLSLSNSRRTICTILSLFDAAFIQAVVNIVTAVDTGTDLMRSSKDDLLYIVQLDSGVRHFYNLSRFQIDDTRSRIALIDTDGDFKSSSKQNHFTSLIHDSELVAFTDCFFNWHSYPFPMTYRRRAFPKYPT